MTAQAVTEPFDHCVDIYDTQAGLVERVAEYLAGSLADGGAAIVIATEAHRNAFAAALASRGIDVDSSRRSGSLRELDAAKTLDRICMDGSPDPVAFDAEVGALVDRMCADGRTVRAYGEMVALLWQAGLVPAAIALEECWNDLGARLPFSLRCSYPKELVDGPDHADEFAAMCCLHSELGGDHLNDGANERAPSTRTFDATSDAPRAARQFVRDTLGATCDPRMLHDVELVVSELVTNAVKHARSDPKVEVSAEAGVIRIVVSDADTVLPVPQTPPSAHSTTGRGLAIVDSIADRWGYARAAGGKQVWVELRRRT